MATAKQTSVLDEIADAMDIKHIKRMPTNIQPDQMARLEALLAENAARWNQAQKAHQQQGHRQATSNLQSSASRGRSNGTERY